MLAPKEEVNEATPDRIEAAFNKCDKNKSGTIEGKEIKKVLESIGINGDKKHVKEALAKFDDDGSKSLDLAEFTAMVDELKVSEAAMGGGQTFVHYNGVRTHSVLERLQLQSDMLDSAVERCVAEGGCLPIVEGV